MEHPHHRRCTGLMASWCPIHGDCCCRPLPGVPVPNSDETCPLHRPDPVEMVRG